MGCSEAVSGVRKFEVITEDLKEEEHSPKYRVRRAFQSEDTSPPFRGRSGTVRVD